MKKILLASMALLCAFQANAGKIVSDSLYSKILGATVRYEVYLPTGFDKTDALYPSIYLLHGLYGVCTDWEKRGRMSFVADEFISSGEMVPTVVIMPTAGNPDIHNVWNGYFNMPGWNYEDFFFKELIPTAEAKYRCIGDKGHRAVMGLSMGGGGSVVYAQKHSDSFSSCYAMSAWFESSTSEIEKGKENDKMQYTRLSVHNNDPVKFIKNADAKTLEALKSVKWFTDCGDDDSTIWEDIEFHKAMKEAGIKHEFRVRDGRHNWEYWHTALRLAFPFASRNFEK